MSKRVAFVFNIAAGIGRLKGALIVETGNDGSPRGATLEVVWLKQGDLIGRWLYSPVVNERTRTSRG